MEIVSKAPLRTASLLWQPATRSYVLSVICKATYRLVPGVVEFGAEQENPNEDDNYWDDDPTRSLYAPSDLVPYKACADVVLVGYAFAPRGEVVRSLVARLIVGTVDKSIEVCADRSWANDGSLREGARFARMPLRYERAAGGPDTPNPVGMRSQTTDVYGATAIPNLQPPGTHLSQRGDWIPAIGFGPIAPSWPGRLGKLGPDVAPHASRLRFDAPLPMGISTRFFNSAPEDQQLQTIRPNERIVLEHLHADHPRLVTSLPGSTPRALVQRANGSESELQLECDTLWIDTNTGRCSVVWRGRLPLSHPSEKGRITITMEEAGANPSRVVISSPVTIDDPDVTFTMLVEGSNAAPVLPFVGNQPAPAPAPPLPARATPPGPTPFAPSSSRPGVNFPSAVPAHVPPVPPVATQGPPASSPWAIGGPKEGGASSNFPPTFEAPPSPPPRQPLPSAGFSGPRFDASSPNVKPPPVTIGEAAARGAASASSAAAAASAAAERSPDPMPVSPVRAAPTPATGGTAREAMTLLWLDEPRADAITACPQWIPILSESEVVEKPEPPKKLNEDGEEEIDYFAEPEEEIVDDEPEPVKKRKRVAKILARGEPADGPGLALAVSEAVTKDGSLDPPIMLAAGELSFPFDAWETLKALVIAATAAAVGDKKLKETLDAVQETAKMPGIERSTSIAEGLATRVREAFVQTNRQLGAGWLDSQAERMLVEGRCYQKRTVLGQTYLRGLLHAPGAEEGIPTYLPESLNKTIPLVTRLRARVIAEVHAQQDQYESYPRALRVLALARMVELTAGRNR